MGLCTLRWKMKWSKYVHLCYYSPVKLDNVYIIQCIWSVVHMGHSSAFSLHMSGSFCSHTDYWMDPHKDEQPDWHLFYKSMTLQVVSVIYSRSGTCCIRGHTYIIKNILVHLKVWQQWFWKQYKFLHWKGLLLWWWLLHFLIGSHLAETLQLIAQWSH